jgi:WD40-like Beta Propeller Repeat
MSPSSRCSTAALAAFAVAITAAGCGSDNPAGPKTLGLSVVAGAGQTDSVLSSLPQALVMQLNEPSGVSGHIVQFSSVQVPNAGGYYAYVHREDSNQPTTFAVDTTLAAGRVEVQVVLGTKAGKAPVIVSVPDFGIVDTVTFTVTPGNLAAITVSPKDTTVSLNGTVTYVGGAADTYGNVLSLPVTYSILSGSATVSGATVTGTGVGQVSVLLTASAKVDTAYIAVLPAGTIAAVAGGVIHIFNLDGSGMQTVPNATSVGAVRWGPSGTILAYDQTISGFYDGSGLIHTVTTAGEVAVVDNTPGEYDQWPAWSRDGSTIYYAKIVGGSESAIWHATPAGANDDSVTTQNPSFDVFPSPSPDGTELAYSADETSTADLRILTLATGAVTDLHIEGWCPVWSPVGQQIAYLTQPGTAGQIAVANADGSGQHVLNTNSYQQNFDWSPDGLYLIAVNANTDQLEVIPVSTGTGLPIGITGYYSPTWQPTSGASPSRVPKSAPQRLNRAFGGWHIR